LDPLHHVRYNRWATGRTLDSVRPLSAEELDRPIGGSYGSLRGTLAHIYKADGIWWARLHGRKYDSLSEFDPPADPAAWEQQWIALLDQYVAWAQAADWNQVIAYRDLKGNPYQRPVWQILLHLTNHDSFHRGQVSNMLRQLGRTPTPQDLIVYYRSLDAPAS
jgi:uncharacterized damage-inducible protein DinB